MGCKCHCIQLSQAVGLLGLVLSSLAIAPPLVSYYVDQEWSIVQPTLEFFQEMLEKEYKNQAITKSTLENLQSFLEGVSENTQFTGVVVVCVASINIFLDVFLLIGSCCHVSILLLPWLILSMVKLIFLGCPAVIFFSLLAVYLYVQGLVLPSLVLLSLPVAMAILSLVVWCMVLAAYNTLQTKTGRQEPDESESIEPLISDVGPVGSTSYNLGQYPQYYPQNHPAQPCGPSSQPSGPSSQPTAPLPSNTLDTRQQFYPTLPVA